jgi:hypothetical protein
LGIGKEMSKAGEELYRRVDEVLHYVWDPLGVSDTPEARDEYCSYLPDVLSLLNTSSDVEQIAAYLSDVIIVRMRVPSNKTKNREVAQLLLDWKYVIEKKYSQVP